MAGKRREGGRAVGGAGGVIAECIHCIVLSVRAGGSRHGSGGAVGASADGAARFTRG